MSTNLSLSLSNPLIRFFRRYHLTIFIVLVVAGLGAAVFFLTSILNDASIGADYESSISAGSIDQATLDRLNALHTSNDTLPAPIPAAGRISPFNE